MRLLFSTGMGRRAALASAEGLRVLPCSAARAELDGPSFNTFTGLPRTQQSIFRGESRDANEQRRLFALDILTRQP